MDEACEVDEKILECVDTAFKKLGESVRKSIYYYLKKDFNLERFEIPKKPEALEKALTSIFGERGAKVIKKLILVEVRNIFQLKKGSSLTFKQAVATIKNSSNHPDRRAILNYISNDLLRTRHSNACRLST